MALIIVLFHLYIFGIVYLFIKNKKRRTGLFLGVFNIIFMIMNILAVVPSFSLEYSTIIFLREELKIHVFANLLWILFNFIYYFFFLYLLKIKKVKFCWKIVGQILISLLVLEFLIVLLPNLTSILAFLTLIFWLSYSIYQFVFTKKNYYVVAIALLFLVLFNSYFTNMGAARFSLFLMGYPKIAYETGLEEIKVYQEKNSVKFSPIEVVPLKDSQVQLIEIKNYGFLKFSNIHKS